MRNVELKVCNRKEGCRRKWACHKILMDSWIGFGPRNGELRRFAVVIRYGDNGDEEVRQDGA